jgi:N-acetylmuramoyl-L-alanine amidase
VSPLPDSLIGLKIAIDPGHFGGKYALLEQRIIQLPAEESYPSVQFDEGTLTVLTAKILKQLLEKAESHVLLTKDKIGQGVYPQDFFEWLKEFKLNPSLLLSDIFRTDYNPLDLLARVNKINNFHPDLTIIIYYNAHQDPLLKEYKTTELNFNLVFVGGSFNKNELQNFRIRYEFLRLLLTSDFSNSVLLSKEILDQFINHLNIPAVKEEDKINCLLKNSIKIEEGVYARNLALTLQIHGPICYGETLCQNNKKEALLLNEKNICIDGIWGPRRAKQVAQAYYEGIQAFIHKKTTCQNQVR